MSPPPPRRMLFDRRLAAFLLPAWGRALSDLLNWLRFLPGAVAAAPHDRLCGRDRDRDFDYGQAV